MMKTTTKYIAIRETEGAYGRTYRRYQECSSKKAGIAWFKGGDLGPCRTVSIYAVEFDEGEDLSTLQPCMKKRIPEVGTLVFKKYNETIAETARTKAACSAPKPKRRHTPTS